MNRTDRKIILSGIASLIALGFAGPAHAACSSPAGVAGDQFYNTTYNVMQYCNGTDWVNMGASGGGASETDPQVGTLTNGKWCTTDGTDIDCTSNAPLTTESDPQVGTLTSGKWCTTNGTLISCTSDAPLTAESDPKVGAVTDTKWCRASGSQVVCDQDAPAAGTGGFDLLNSGTVTSQATLNITLPAGYQSYKIVLQNLVPATDDVALWLRTSSNGGTSYDSGASDYKWVAYYAGVDSGGSGFDGVISDSSDSEIEVAGGFGSSGNENGFVEIHITNPATSKAKLIEATTVKYDNAQAFAYDSLAGARMSSTAIDAVRLFMSSGNIASSDWALYGYSD